ncbi:MFS transporter [Streptomyces sp. NPDC059740]|uniref:MFS transporter n=1 Tax=Streptomyces sp. NPDC059740 TaxID=3346926 RepID=UPI00365C84C4
MTQTPRTGRGWLLRLVITFTLAQGAVSMARPAVSYRALALGADDRAVGLVTAVYALLPLLVAVPLGRRTDRARCTPLLALGVALIAGGCALSAGAGSLTAMAAWSGVMGLGHLCFVIGAQSIVARRSAPADRDRNFGHFTIGASLGQLLGPVAAGAVVSAGTGGRSGGSALALVLAAAGGALAYLTLWRLEHPGPDGSPAGPAAPGAARVPVHRILRTRGVAPGILVSLAVLSATDILTAYLPVVGEQRSVAPATVGLLLSVRAAATVACRLVMTPLLRLCGRTLLLASTCVLGGVLCAAIALPLPVAALAPVLALLGFCLGVGQPLSMTTVVQAAPDEARSTALALRLSGNRLGQVAAPAGAGAVAGVVGSAAPFVMLGALLVVSAGAALRGRGRPDAAAGEADREGAGVPGPPAAGRPRSAAPPSGEEEAPSRRC